MYQYEKRLDCHALGQEIKRRRKAKRYFFSLSVLMGSLLYAVFLVGGVMQYLGGGPSELFPDGYAVSLCLIQHTAGILGKTSGDK